MYKTTEKQFKVFCQWFNAYIQEFGLLGWKIVYVHQDLSDTGAAACVAFDYEARCIEVSFATEDTTPCTNQDIKELAYHEALEVFLGRLRMLCKSRFIQEREVDEEIHDIIQRLINLKFKGKEL